MIEIKNAFFSYLEDSKVIEQEADRYENLEEPIKPGDRIVIESETDPGIQIKGLEFDLYSHDDNIQLIEIEPYVDADPHIAVDVVDRVDGGYHIMVTDKDIKTDEWSGARILLELQFELEQSRLIIRVRKLEADA